MTMLQRYNCTFWSIVKECYDNKESREVLIDKMVESVSENDFTNPLDFVILWLEVNYASNE